MSLDERVREAEAEGRADSVARRLSPWLAFGAVALVLLELFGHPLLAASAFALKFAVPDLLTARWVLGRDPDRGRAWAVGLFHLAAGFWKAATVNFGLFTAAILYTLVTGQPAWPQRPPGAPPPDFLDDGLTPFAAPTLFGHILEFGLGMLAVMIAYSRHVKLWLGPGLHAARRRDEWPPADVPGANWLGLVPSLVAAGVPAVIWAVGAAGLVAVPVPAAVNPQDWANVLPVHGIFGFALTLAPALAGACCRDRQHRYLLAETPDECWPPGR